MPSFKGTYQYTIDSKGRVNIPAKFRKILPEEAEKTFVVCRGSDGCLNVYPQHEWNVFEERLRKLSWTQKDNRQLVRALLQDASESQYDAQGRISIPPQLLKMAHIKKDVLILGTLDHIELWNPEEYERYTRGAEAETYETLLERIALQ